MGVLVYLTSSTLLVSSFLNQLIMCFQHREAQSFGSLKRRVTPIYLECQSGAHREGLACRMSLDFGVQRIDDFAERLGAEVASRAVAD